MNFLDEGLKMLDGGFFTGCYPIHGVNGKVHLREEMGESARMSADLDEIRRTRVSLQG